MSAPLPTRKRRPGREHLDQPAAVVTPTPAPDNLSFLDDVYGVLSSRGEEDRRLEERKTVDRKADDVKRDADRRADDLKAATTAQEDDQRLLKAQETRSVEAEEDRQDDIHQTLKKTALDDAQADEKARAGRKKADEDWHRKPIPVFTKITSAERIATGFEAALKLIGAGLLRAFSRGRQAIPPFDFEGFKAREPFRATVATVPLPVPDEKPSAPKAKAKESDNKIKATSQEDKDIMDRKAWNLATSRDKAQSLYQDKRVFSVLAEVFERKSFGDDLLEAQAAILVKISPEVVTLLEGGYGDEPIREFQAEFAMLERRLGKPHLVAERLAELIHKRSVELSQVSTFEPEIEEEPSAPPADSVPEEEDAPDAPTPTVTPAPRYTPKGPGGL